VRARRIEVLAGQFDKALVDALELFAVLFRRSADLLAGARQSRA
jgi:hypothetical protein